MHKLTHMPHIVCDWPGKFGWFNKHHVESTVACKTTDTLP